MKIINSNKFDVNLNNITLTVFDKVNNKTNVYTIIKRPQTNTIGFGFGFDFNGKVIIDCLDKLNYRVLVVIDIRMFGLVSVGVYDGIKEVLIVDSFNWRYFLKSPIRMMYKIVDQIDENLLKIC